MQKKIEIYVIIPVYNAVNYLSQAVESVIFQPYNNIKVILINDGSVDGSGQLCDQLASENEKVIAIHQKNSGVSAARNNGLKYVFSQNHENKQCYIAFLDADDVWCKNVFCKDIIELLSNGYDLIGLQSATCNGNLTKMMPLNHMDEGEYSGGKEAFYLHAKQHFAAMLYSSKLIRQYNVRFHEEISYTEDKLFQMSCIYLANLIYLKNKLFYLYRNNEKSLVHTRNYGIPYFERIINSYFLLDKDMEEYETPERGKLTEGKILANIYVMDMADEHFMHFGKKSEFFKVLKSNPEWCRLVEGEIAGISANKRYLKLCESPIKYIFCMYIKGIIWMLMRKILRFAPIKKNRDLRRFPLDTQNVIINEVQK